MGCGSANNRTNPSESKVLRIYEEAEEPIKKIHFSKRDSNTNR